MTYSKQINPLWLVATIALVLVAAAMTPCSAWAGDGTEQFNVSSLIRLHPTSQNIVNEKLHVLGQGRRLDPIRVFRLPHQLTLVVNGHHRLEAHRQRNIATVSGYAVDYRAGVPDGDVWAVMTMLELSRIYGFYTGRWMPKLTATMRENEAVNGNNYRDDAIEEARKSVIRYNQSFGYPLPPGF